MPSADSPRVSIVIPVLNAERFLEETVASVLAQTFRNWELLLVDDGSTDRSREIARRFAAAHEERILCLAHDGGKNRGQFATRALGARHARAEVLALLDADDLWNEDYLARHLRLWDEALSMRAIGLSYGPALYWHPAHRGADFVQPMPPGAPRIYGPGELLEPFVDAAYATTPCPSCALVRREALLGIERFEGAAKESLAFEDQILWWLIAARWPVAVHTNVWMKYRQHAASSVQRMGSRARARRAELAFLAAIGDYLRATLPDHPILARGKLAARVAALEAPRPLGTCLLDALAERLPGPVYVVVRARYRAARAAWRRARTKTTM